MNRHFSSQTTQSATAAALRELCLFGVRPGSDEPDYRPLPDLCQIESSIASIAASLSEMLAETRLEHELKRLLWFFVNTFHRQLSQTQRSLDDNEAKLRELQHIQDGSEVRDVELQRATNEGFTLTEQRNTYEVMRDVAAEHFQAITGSAWLPRSGSKVSHRNLTAAVIESRDYVSAKRRSENETHCPEGTRNAFAGGADFQDINKIWAVLDKIQVKYPDMILLHGGSPKGAELIAAKWAENRGITQVVFKPDWKAHNKAAPFKKNDKLLETVPVGMIACPGNGITENLVDKARKIGIPVMRVTNGSQK